jgi:hypothetical protein
VHRHCQPAGRPVAGSQRASGGTALMKHPESVMYHGLGDGTKVGWNELRGFLMILSIMVCARQPRRGCAGRGTVPSRDHALLGSAATVAEPAAAAAAAPGSKHRSQCLARTRAGPNCPVGDRHRLWARAGNLRDDLPLVMAAAATATCDVTPLRAAAPHPAPVLEGAQVRTRRVRALSARSARAQEAPPPPPPWTPAAAATSEGGGAGAANSAASARDSRGGGQEKPPRPGVCFRSAVRWPGSALLAISLVMLYFSAMGLCGPRISAWPASCTVRGRPLHPQLPSRLIGMMSPLSNGFTHPVGTRGGDRHGHFPHARNGHLTARKHLAAAGGAAGAWGPGLSPSRIARHVHARSMVPPAVTVVLKLPVVRPSVCACRSMRCLAAVTKLSTLAPWRMSVASARVAALSEVVMRRFPWQMKPLHRRCHQVRLCAACTVVAFMLAYR